MFVRIGTVAALSVLLAAPALAGDRDGDRRDDDRRTVYQIDLEDAERRHSTVDRITAVDGEGALVVKGWKGLSRSNQNRIDYSGAPLLGRFSENRYDRQDFAAHNRVGDVRIDGDEMALVLDDGADVPRDEVLRLAVLNTSFAYETRVKLKPGDWSKGAPADWRSRGRSVGGVYWTGAGALMALVRPFVVLDGAAW